MFSFIEFGRDADGFRWGPLWKEEIVKITESADVVFFDNPNCPFCRQAEAALQEKGIEFKKVPISSYKSEVRHHVGKSSAPAVFIKGTYVGGCNDGTEPWHGVLPMLANGKFEEMLKA